MKVLFTIRYINSHNQQVEELNKKTCFESQRNFYYFRLRTAKHISNMNLLSLRKGMLAAFLCAVSFFNFSQNTVRCYTDEMHQQLLQDHPELESRQQFESWMQSSVIQQQSMAIIGGVYYIPVVVHVIHNGEAVGTGSNVSFAAIQSQIDVLNEDFRKMLGSNGWNTHPDGADTKIEFCLSQRRPDGSAFPVGEPGVNRINRTTAGFTTPPFTTTYIDATIKPYTYNNNVPTATRGWDPAKYMNIWLCNISGGILGYAQFPQSPLGGMGCGTPAAATDGVVFLYNSIGKSAVTGFTGVYNEGRTATHEIGHWLGLRHIWGDGGCTVDDFCNDTPEAAAANFGCPAGTNSCTAAPDAGPDMIENYMDYTDDLCMNIFTNDQKMRMRTVLENSPLRATLINSDACTPPNANDASVVNINNPKGDNCPGSITPNVTLRNRGSSNLTSATISYKIDNGTATTFAWTGSLTPGSTANVALPAFTTTLGQHTIKAYSTLPNGSADLATVYDTSSITFTISNGINAPFTENFDGSVFPPDVRWVVENVNSDCYTWVGASAVSIAGTFSNNAAQFPGFGNTSASTENLITPIFTLPCNATAANLQFDVAYRRRNATVANYERLYIEISEDCGTTWNATPVYDKNGTALQVLTTTLTTYYQPVGTTDWRTETIDLLPFVTTISKNVKFRIRAVAANGNNIYIDNLKFNATTPGEINVTQATATVLDEGSYSFGSVGSGSSSTATFTITNTGTSNLILTGPINVTGTGFALGTSFGTTTVAAGATTTFTVVFSPTAGGSYTGNVSFGTNDCDEPIYNFVLTGAAAILPPVASFTATPLLACVGSPVTFTNTSTNATTYSWNFGASATPATSTLANPTVTFTAAGTYTIALTATGAGGSNTQTSTNYITVVSSTGAALPLTEGFTTATFPPTGWSIVNANASPTTWARSATVGFAPTAGNSMMFNNFSYNDADDDQVRLTGVSMVGYATAQLQFDVAYAPFNTTRFDGLEVLVSTDCGATFTSVYSKSNTVLATAPATTASFTPTTAQWRTETVNLTPYVGNSKVIVAFKNLSGNGNRLYVDNINLTAVPPTAAPVASFTPSVTTVCAGQTVTFNNTSTGSPTSYSWTFGGGTPSTSTATSPVVTFNTAGTYTVALTATNASGSNTSNQANIITVNVVPTLTSTNQTVCAGSPATISATGTPAGGTYAWSTGGTGSSVTVSPTATTPYTVTYTANGCSSTAATSTVTVNALPTLTNTNQTVCAGSPATVVATGSPAGGTYAWSTGGTGSSVTVSPTATTAYTVTYTANGCSSTAATSTVTVNALPILTSTNQTVCAGSPATVVATGSPAGGTYAWSTGGTGSSVTVTPTATTPYTVTYTANGCSSTAATSTVTVNAIPTLTSTNQTVCAGSSATISATGTPAGGTYAWSNGGTNSSETVTPTATTPYTVTYTANGCSSTASTSTVTVNALPTLTSTNQTVCAGSPATVVATGSPAGGTYAWSNGGTNSSNTITPSATTQYTVSYTANGCTSTVSTSTVTVDAVPTVNAGLDTTVCANALPVVLSASSPNSGVTYQWNTSETTPQISVSAAGTYTVQVTLNGCSSSDAVVVTVDPCSGIVENTMGISLYPNPTTGKLNIVSDQQVAATIEVISLDGKVVLNETINGTTKVLDVSSLTVGTYMLRMNEASNVTIFRVIKQ